MADIALASLRAPFQKPATVKTARPRKVTIVTNTDSRPQSAAKALGAHENSNEEHSDSDEVSETDIFLTNTIKADVLAAEKSADAKMLKYAEMLKSVKTERQSILEDSGDEDSSVSPSTYMTEVGYAAGVECRQAHILTSSVHNTDVGYGAEKKDVGEPVAKKE